MRPRKSRYALDPKEHQVQTAVIQLLRFQGVPGLFWFHPANEGRRAPRTGAFLKKMGMLAGVSDLVIVRPGGRVCFLELKSPTGETQPNQITFGEVCEANGAPYAVAHSSEEAATILHQWGALRSNPFAKQRAAA